MAKLAEKSYAIALFDTGCELVNLDIIKKDFDLVNSVLESEPKLIKILTHPKIANNEKKDLILSLFSKLKSVEMKNFLCILVDKKRENLVFNIYNEFLNLYNEHKDILEVSATTAFPMSEANKEKLVNVLSTKSNKNIVLKNEIDKELLGGVLLRINDKIIDGSILGQLNTMDKILKGLSL